MGLLDFAIGTVLGGDTLLPIINPHTKWTQQEMFISAVERQKQIDWELAKVTGNYFKAAPFPKPLSPLQKTAFAYWRDTTDLEFPGAQPIQIAILRELRRRNA